MKEILFCLILVHVKINVQMRQTFNWQDWNTVKTFNVTDQWAETNLTCCGRRGKHRIEILILKSIFNPPVSPNEQ